MNEKFVGIDVSKYAFDLNINGSNKVEHFNNDVKDIKKCAKTLVKLAPALVVIEVTSHLILTPLYMSPFCYQFTRISVFFLP